jgi:hypothetical protein
MIISFPQAPFVEVLSSGYQLVFGTILPLVVIVGANTLIIVTVQKAARERRSMQGTNQKGAAKSEMEAKHLTRMLIVVSFAYVVVSVPYRLYVFLIGTSDLSEIYDLNDTYWSVRYNMQYQVIYNIWLMNYSINFYLYCLCGGRRFRLDTKDMIRSISSVCFKRHDC